MKILVTGSAGHLGEGLMRTLRDSGEHEPIGLDVAPRRSPTSSARSPIATSCAAAWRGVDAVLHAATLHKPHVATHPRQDFVDVNITGTLNLLEEAVGGGRRALRLHEHDQRVRPRADAAARRSRPRG